MRILITGSNGMLGSDLVRELHSTYEVFGLGLRPNRHPDIQYIQADLSNKSAVLKAVSVAKPAIIIHAAAYVDVDGCELNPDLAYSINTRGTQHITEASNQNGAVLFFISTDYVFDGLKKDPYTENDLPNPLSVYGKSKLQAEEYIKSSAHSAWIIRSSWLFGTDGRNFFRTFLERIKKGEELKVVDDQKGAPTYTKDLAQALKRLIENGSRTKGCVVYHLANRGETTWFQAAKRVLKKTGLTLKLIPITSNELNRPAKRPANSVFCLDRIKHEHGVELRPWDEAFEEFWGEVLNSEWQEGESGGQNKVAQDSIIKGVPKL